MVSPTVAVLLLGASLVKAQAAVPAAAAATTDTATVPAAATSAEPVAGSTSFTDLIGTWNSKANSTMTGSGFYDPANDKFTEPKHTGISYSFSEDGHFEEAYYRAVANPSNPNCTKGIIQWQHGKFEKLANGSLQLSPIKVDGRQLFSDRCAYKTSVYTRYNASEIFQRYSVYVDTFNEHTRLDLFKFDGSPMIPLYLAMSPPEMLPTSTLNPLTTSTPGAKPTSKVKRSFAQNVLAKRTSQQKQADKWWWFGVFLTASGGALYFFF